MYYIVYRPTQVYDVQISKADQPDWCNKNIYETYLQTIYGRTSKDPKNLHDKHVTVMNNNADI